jgi:hypothetical protein
MGTISHILSFYTAIMHCCGKSPLLPWKDLNHKWYNLVLCICSVLTTVTLAAITMSNCRNSWPFVLISFWKLTLSFSLNFVGILQCGKTESKGYGNDGFSLNVFMFGTALYWIGCVVGAVGILTVVRETLQQNHGLQIATYVFIAVTASGLVVGLLVGVFVGGSACYGILFAPGAVIFSFLVAAVFYSDWVLAAVERNWMGVPASDNKFVYWLYFMAKRLPLLSF